MNRRDFFKNVAVVLGGSAVAVIIGKTKTPSLIERIKEAHSKTKFKTPLKGETRVYVVLDEFADGSHWEMTSGRFDGFLQRVEK